MSWIYSHWPAYPVEFGDSINRRTEELYQVQTAETDDMGLIERPVLPLRDIVLFPNMLTPLFLDQMKAVEGVELSMREAKTMIAVAQLDAETEAPSAEDFYSIGTEVAVSRMLQTPDGYESILTHGRRRIEIVEFIQGPILMARGKPILEPQRPGAQDLALKRAVLTLFEKCVQLNRNLPEEVYMYALSIKDPGWLGDLIASALDLSVPERQRVLEIFDPSERLQHVSLLLGKELDVLELEDEIHSKVQNEVDRSQREVYLREQMRVIQQELGEEDLWSKELKELRAKVHHLQLPEEVAVKALKELDRLSQLPPLSPEAGILNGYIRWIVELPWSDKTDDNLDIRHSAKILDRDHYALQKAKDRILEYMAVRKLAPLHEKQPILCFVGPPGTGKTSLGKSIAEALGRKFVRISLGGVRDEAEIRGHRRTYIGALPGRILQTMHRAGTINPLFMLDEIDKLGRDYRGDPSSALLEVLDPEQNHAFSDHYLEIAYDLSKVMFITTANTTETIPPALLDRMELIEFPGYNEEEKLEIAKNFLIPRQLQRNGINAGELLITVPALQRIIREYTWEAGVRNLEREIGRVVRKVARRKAEGRRTPRRILPSRIHTLLGPPQITPYRPETEDQIGLAIGLAWTENGGETLVVEVLLVEGKGNLQITGQVGDVMQESAQAAISYVKSKTAELDIDPELFEKMDIHIHIPEGSIPKDGPSAGITIATAAASALSERFVSHSVGMSGEITLRGRVLAIGGVREKVLAAYRAEIGTVLIPKENEKDLGDLPRKVRQKLDIRSVSHMDEVLEFALLPAGR
jgi:ATP-dependent Lon protease